MNILTKKIKSQINIKGSHFITELFPCNSSDNARNIVKEQKNNYKDATHVCHAFVIGKNLEVMGCADDGEPSGTAGRPMLDVLKGSGVTNVVAAVTRYFGGTLLGTGGLVKAYQESVRSALEQAVAENAIEELFDRKQFCFDCEYGLYEQIKRMSAEYRIYNLTEEFLDKVKVTGEILEEQFEEFQLRIKNLSLGKISKIQ